MAVHWGGRGRGHSSRITVPVVPGGGGGSPLSALGSPATAQWGVAYSDTAVTAAGGTAPYTITGLPSGLSASFTGGAATISGTPV